MFFRYSVSDDIQNWIYENFVWAIEQGLLTPKTPLVFATKEFFAAPKGEGDVVVTALIRDIQHALAIPERAVKVVATNSLPAELGADYNAMSEIGGTWQDDDAGEIIQYNPNLLNNPISLISTLTHEVMHGILHGIEEYPPGGEEADELNTDLHCITMGFGILQITNAQQMGWAGYMRQSSRIHALAMFVLVRDLSIEVTISALPDASKRQFKKALRQIEKDHEGIAFLKEKLRLTVVGNNAGQSI
jgi:hypothetical protein